MDAVSVRDWANALSTEADAEVDQLGRLAGGGRPLELDKIRTLAALATTLYTVEALAVSLHKLENAHFNGGGR